MRPRYIILMLALVAAVVVVVMGPVRGRGVEAGL